MTKGRRIQARVLWTVPDCAEYWGVGESRARTILANAEVRHVRAYPAEEVMAIERPGQGARTDLRRAAEA